MDKARVAAEKPYVMKVEPGTYAWCSCGLSKNQPFCDGSHKPTPLRPVIEKVEKEKNVAWCGCKQTGSPPFCDGSHNKLQE